MISSPHGTEGKDLRIRIQKYIVSLHNQLQVLLREDYVNVALNCWL